MKVLYIDTTTSYLYTGLVVDGKLIAEIKKEFGKDLSRQALPKISDMIKEAKLKPTDIDKIMVVNGPGSFTGIRVGVTIAKTFAYTLKKEVVTLLSLEAMAISNKKENVFKIPIIDARRGYIYGAIYNQENVPILKPQYISLEALKSAANYLLEDFEYISNQEFTDLKVESYNPNIEKIVNALISREGTNPHAINPIYLKQTEAEEKQNTEII